MGKPKISVLTPCNRVIPWYNARLINVLSQDFSDWEWVILDNSEDGCVKNYIEKFFNSVQGRKFSHRKDSVRVIHEPSFAKIPFSDGRLGKIRNRCLQLAECGDDGFVFMLDSDDFIFDGLLRNVSEIADARPKCEYISGMCQDSLAQNTNSGVFFYHNEAERWHSTKSESQTALLDEFGFKGKNFSEFKRLNSIGKMQPLTQIPYNSELNIDEVNLHFKFDKITVQNGNSYGFIAKSTHPHIYRKKAFLEKIGGYITDNSREDEVDSLFPFLLSNPSFIMKPCYCRVILVDENGYYVGATNDVTLNNNVEAYKKSRYAIMEKEYEILGDCNKRIYPELWK